MTILILSSTSSTSPTITITYVADFKKSAADLRSKKRITCRVDPQPDGGYICHCTDGVTTIKDLNRAFEEAGMTERAR